MKVIEGGNGSAPVKCWTDGVEVKETAEKQLRNIAALPFIFKHVAVMPDVHWGRGATIGSVIATRGAIIPAAVGVDLGCGMMAVRTSLTASDMPDSMQEVHDAIDAAVPTGGPGVKGSWKEPGRGETGLAVPAGVWAQDFARRYAELTDEHPIIDRGATWEQLGTLGTGNHFIEVCLDENDDVWLMLHSGSRGLGNRIGSFFIERARDDMRRWFINLPDQDLAYIVEGSDLFDEYVGAVTFAQDFARRNRQLMMENVVWAVRTALHNPFELHDVAVNCHHNYIARENHFGQNVWITRKGAVRARKGDLGIIPGSMGAKSFIVRGRSNPQSFHSCSHGAGRRMSRNEARRTFTVVDHALATAGVACRKDASVLDETPGAYKDIDAVMAAQSDLVTIEHTLKQICCVKG